MNIGIVTRSDIFPPYHGAAAKILSESISLSYLGHNIYIFPYNSKKIYYIKRGDILTYTKRESSFNNNAIIKKLFHSLLSKIGYPKSEHFMYLPAVDPIFWLEILGICKKYKIDFLISHFPGYSFACNLVSVILHIPVIVVQHNIEYQRIKDTMLINQKRINSIKKIELALCDLADHVVTCSKKEQDILINDGICKSKITVIPHGIDILKYKNARKNNKSLKNDLKINSNEKVVIFHGTLDYPPNRNAVLLLENKIIYQLKQMGIKVVALIVGNNPPHKIGRFGDFIYTGGVEKLEDYIKLADVAVVPLLEGGGTRIKILEYFAACIPVISTSKGAEGLLVENNKHLIIADNWNDFVNSILYVLQYCEKALYLTDNALSFLWEFEKFNIASSYNMVFNTVFKKNALTRRKNNSIYKSKIKNYIHSKNEDKSLKENKDSKKSIRLMFMITRRCNLKCSFCDLGKNRHDMDIQDIHKVIAGTSDTSIKELVLTGGEPLIHPWLNSCILQAKAIGLNVNITTNGLLLDKAAKQLELCGTNSISVSIDGLKDLHDSLRNHKGLFKKIIKGIQVLKKETSIFLSIYFVVMEHNVHQLLDIYQLSKSLDCHFDFWPVNNSPEFYIKTKKAQKIYIKAIEKIAEENPEVLKKLKYLKGAVEYHSDNVSNVRCLGLIDQIGVDNKGNVLPCCRWDMPSLSVGNAIIQPLNQVLNSLKANQLKNDIYNKGCRLSCYNHSLYEFSRETGESFIVI